MKQSMLFGAVMGLVVVAALVSPCWSIHVTGDGTTLTTEELNSGNIRREGQALEVIQQARDTDPPVITPVPGLTAKRGEIFTVSFEIIDASGVASAQVWYRTVGQEVFQDVALEQRGGTRFAVDIPAYAMIGDGLEYYATASDELGNGPAFWGTEQHPLRLLFGVQKNSMVTPVSFILCIWSLLAFFMVSRLRRKDAVLYCEQKPAGG